MNKKLLFTAFTLLSLLAFGAVQQMDRTLSPRLQSYISGILITHKAGQATDALINANRLTRVLGASATIDVAAATAACNDSAGTTILGARVGDPCLVGSPTTITGAGTGLSSSFSCYVSAADTVKLRHCPVGVSADDPASAVWFFRVISSQ